MRLTLAAFGLELDVTFGVASVAEDDPAAALNGGTLASTPMGFVPRMEIPEQVPAPQHCPSWDEPSERQ